MEDPNKKEAPAEFGDQAGAKNQDELYNAQKVLINFANKINSDSKAIKSIVDGGKPFTPSEQNPTQNSTQNKAKEPIENDGEDLDGLSPEQRYEKLLNAGKEFDGKKLRLWAFLVYPDSAYEDWRERLDNIHVPGFISPLHDKDKKSNGTAKKPHHHVLLRFSSNVPYSDILGLQIKCLGINGTVTAERVHDFGGYARYLCHLDNKNKTKYNPDDVQELGGMDYGLFSISKRDEEAETILTINDVVDFIEANKITNFFQLYKAAKTISSEDDYKLLKTIIHKTYFINSLVNGNYQEITSDINAREREINDEYNHMRTRNQYIQAERENMLEQIDDLKREVDRLRGLTM